MVLWARISNTHHIIVTRAVASNNNLFFLTQFSEMTKVSNKNGFFFDFCETYIFKTTK